jgi:hypothetical protein
MIKLCLAHNRLLVVFSWRIKVFLVLLESSNRDQKAQLSNYFNSIHNILVYRL